MNKAKGKQLKLFSKVLVANRGEISVRVQNGLRELGITAVAVYSDPDRGARHTLIADEAYPLGPGPSGESYLRIDKILDVAKAAGVDAIHPGYGFLSENPEFSQAVTDAGLTFIGPGPEAMREMGNKIAARRRMKAAGVPVVPGLVDPVKSPEEARGAAKEIGFPVLIKAAAGGGGKGMRVVRRMEDMDSALERTQGEAGSAFGDDSVYVERFVENPRHIEVQVLADHHGNCIHLFERECSVQRRHQKVVEESPSPSIGPKLRDDLCAAAVRAARSVNYVNAGTVEFIVDEEDNFFFLEMNTRLQVEHPVTEFVVGVDLVTAQVRLAAGGELPWEQQSLKQRGHALEFRIYAEDPWRNFAPSLGRIVRLRPPNGAGIRNDLGIREGYDVPLFYDPLLAKLVVFGEDRAQALARSRRALGEYRILGLTHNIPLHQWVVSHPVFTAGRYSTRFLDDHFDPDALRDQMSQDELEVLAAALAMVEAGVGQARQGAATSPPRLSPWGQQGRSIMTKRTI